MTQLDDQRTRLRSIGRTDPIHVLDREELEPLQHRIYELTEPYLDHSDADTDTEDKLSLPFAEVPPSDLWSRVMQTVNASEELSSVINSPSVRQTFAGLLETNVSLFPISFFRAQFYQTTRSVYRWHQDIGTWYLSKDPAIADAFPHTMWLSVNGATRENSLEFADGMHNLPLADHVNVEGQGRFHMSRSAPVDRAPTFTPETSPGEAVVFHPLLPHRSVAGKSLRPRYSVDIRYHDPERRFSGPVSLRFRLRRQLSSLFGTGRG